MNVSPERSSSATRPPKKNAPSPSDPPVNPLVALFSRANAPTRRASAAAADFRSDGLMRSGSTIVRILSLLHDAIGIVPAVTANAASRRKRTVLNMRVIGEILYVSADARLEAKVETKCPVRRWRRSLEWILNVSFRTRCHLRVDAGETRPRFQISAGRRDAQPIASNEAAVDPALRREKGDCDLAQLREITRIPETGLGARRMVTHRDDARLFGERRCLIGDTATIRVRLT